MFIYTVGVLFLIKHWLKFTKSHLRDLQILGNWQWSWTCEIRSHSLQVSTRIQPSGYRYHGWYEASWRLKCNWKIDLMWLTFEEKGPGRTKQIKWLHSSTSGTCNRKRAIPNSWPTFGRTPFNEQTLGKNKREALALLWLLMF